MSIAAIDTEEFACLEQLSRDGAGRPDRCEPPLIRRLLARGLIEPIPLTWLPVPVARSGYRLTAAGELARREHVSKY